MEPRSLEAASALYRQVIVNVVEVSTPEVAEACKILEEGIAYRSSDIDIMWLHGFGFPRYRGGLMFWADQIGPKAIYDQISVWHQRYGNRWAPSPYLRALAESGTSFRNAKPGK